LESDLTKSDPEGKVHILAVKTLIKDHKYLGIEMGDGHINISETDSMIYIPLVGVTGPEVI
jgi:hypothetical protein